MAEPRKTLSPLFAGLRCLSGGAATLLCCGCGNILHNAVQASCGCRFCQPCFSEFGSSAITNSLKAETLICSTCHSEINPDESFEDLFARKEVAKLEVACQGEKCGCTWQGRVEDYQAHHGECDYVTVACPAYGCDAAMPRNQLTHHRSTECAGRVVRCQFCDAEIRALERDQHLRDVCTKVTLTCPNTCGAMDFSRDEIPTHRKTCALEKVHCYYSGAGCAYHGPRNVLPTHHESNVAYHMQLIYRVGESAKQAAAENGREVVKLKSELQEERACRVELEKQMNKMILERSEAAEMRKRFEIMQSSFENLSKQVAIFQGSKEVGYSKVPIATGDPLAITMPHSKAVVLSGTGTGTGGQDVINLSQADRLAITSGDAATGVSSAGLHYRDIAELRQHTAVLTQRVDRADRSIAVQDLQISDMGIRQDLAEVKGCDGVLLWRISEISRRLQEANSGRTPSLYSPPFFTSQSGYKMCARIYLSGDGAGRTTHISLFFVIMRGEFDALLPWPFRQKVKLSLVDQTPFVPARDRQDVTEVFRPDVRSSSFQRPVAEMNIATGCPQFARQSVLTSERYVRDNTLFIKIEVSKQDFVSPDSSSLEKG